MNTPLAQTRLCDYPRSFEAAVDTINADDSTGRSFFVLPHAELDSDIQKIANARAATLHNEVMVHVSRLSPLGIGTLKEMLAAANSTLSTAQLKALCTRLESDIHCFALLKSVSRLQVTSASVIQHIYGWFPPSRFVAQAHGKVLSTKKTLEKASVLADRFANNVLVVAAGASTEGLEFIDDLASHVGPSVRIERTVTSHSYWGNSPLAEWCFAPSNLDALIRNITSCSDTCVWCNEPFVPPVCPTCSTPGLIGEMQ